MNNPVLDLSRVESREVAPQSDAVALIQALERAARDPQVSIDKLERLFEIRERIVTRAAETEFNKAMSAAQAEMSPIAVDAANQQTRSKYASYAALDRAIRPIYTKHGFAVSYDEADIEKAEYVRIVAHVSHRDGFSRDYHRDMPADGKGAKGGDVMTKTHASGAAQSYAMRYLLRAIWNLAVGEEDTDGNTLPRISEEQAAELEKLIQDGGDMGKALRYLKVNALTDIPAKNFDLVLKDLQRLKAERAKARATKKEQTK